MNKVIIYLLFGVMLAMQYNLAEQMAALRNERTVIKPTVCYVNYALSPVETHQWKGRTK